MPSTYEPIATTTLVSSATDFTFTSIPSTYTDLRLVLVPLKASGTLSPRLQFNSDTSSVYSWTSITGDGASATSGRDYTDNIRMSTVGYPISPEVGFGTVDIFSYAGSTFKTCLTTQSSDKNGSGVVARFVNLWRSTSAITSIKVFDDGGSFDAGTIGTLYGIKNA